MLTFSHVASAAEAGCKVDGQGKVVNPCPRDAAMKLCKRAKKINGEQQFIGSLARNQFLSDTCDFRVTEVLGANDANPIFGKPFSPSAPLANCPPNTSSNPSLKINLEQGSARISGDFVNDNDEFAASFLGMLGAEWGKVTTQSTITDEIKTVTSERTVNVPEGKKGTFEFVPRRAQIKGVWTITGDDPRNGGGGGPLGPKPTPWETTLEVTIDAPLVLPTGAADGEAKSKLTDCTGKEFENDDPEPFPKEPGK
ncbi:hypothetical protein E1193_24845 [Micromonospora sp. KC606]|uniref:hypothetical protein n=1 Tax=Micromonospora sp. KC606 TaxID=2530379 RepID=UPI0010463F45|nr:hypothetical protein [Micromonospora sp. KC606]TDC75840.1 hypothetical protein E1193_24845 [Micromonospora sp. KC606]